jgi:adenylate cyclase
VRCYERRDFRFRASEASSMSSDLGVPLLLAQHVVAERHRARSTGIERGYAQALHAFFCRHTDARRVQTVAVFRRVDSRLHRRVFFWLRLKRWYPRAEPALFAAAVLLPTLRSKVSIRVDARSRASKRRRSGGPRI